MFVSYLLNPMLSFSNKCKYTELLTTIDLLDHTCLEDKTRYIQGWVEYDCPLGEAVADPGVGGGGGGGGGRGFRTPLSDLTLV